MAHHYASPTDSVVDAAIAALEQFTVTRANAPALLAIWRRVAELSLADRAEVLDHFGPREQWSPPVIPRKGATDLPVTWEDLPRRPSVRGWWP